MQNVDPDIEAICADDQPAHIPTARELNPAPVSAEAVLRARVIELEQAIKDLPGELGDYSGCENTAGIEAAVDHVNYVIGRLGLNE